MDESLRRKIQSYRENGKKILLKQDHLGQGKIKVLKGNFGLFAKRYTTDRTTYDAIRLDLHR